MILGKVSERDLVKRTLMILLLCVLGAGLAACAVHSDRSLGADSAAATLHDFGCGGPPGPERRPVSFFQPPEHSA